MSPCGISASANQRAWTLPGSDQVVAEGASQEGAGNPSAARFPLQIPGNAMASVQEESPQLSLLCTVARAAVQEPPVGVATSHTRGTCVVRPAMGTYRPSVTPVIAHMPCRGASFDFLFGGAAPRVM